MADERPNNAQGVSCDDDRHNADGQTARNVTNTTGEYSVERAREGFDRALGRGAGAGQEPNAEAAVRDNGP